MISHTVFGGIAYLPTKKEKEKAASSSMFKNNRITAKYRRFVFLICNPPVFYIFVILI